MGADLIAIIAFGPERIVVDEDKTAKIARLIRKYLEGWAIAAELLLLGEQDVPVPPLEFFPPSDEKLHVYGSDKPPGFATVEQLRASDNYKDRVEGVLTDCDHELEGEHVWDTLADLEEHIREFVDFWNGPDARDTTWCFDPDHPGRKVVVAGELSWGDEPEGLGYQTLKLAFELGTAQALEIK